MVQVAPKPNTFMPFGNGAHSCPGSELAKLEMLILLHHLITTYRYVHLQIFFPFIYACTIHIGRELINWQSFFFNVFRTSLVILLVKVNSCIVCKELKLLFCS